MSVLTHPGRTVWLLVLWLALWGTVTPANVASGLVVAVAVQRLPDPFHPTGGLSFRPWPALRLVGWMAVKTVESSLVVAREVVTRSRRINAGVVEVPLRGASEPLVTIVANALGLIPGTITVEVERDPPTVFIHALHLHTVEDVRDEIHELEARVIRAFGTPEAVAGLAPDDSVTLSAGRMGDPEEGR
jgi:multicomponent Na+:H+ antiporter subunit E